METMITFLVKSTLSLSLLYLPYHFLFRKETHFTLNRIYLLTSIVLSFIIPLFQNPFRQ